jgi:hypothetical protein
MNKREAKRVACRAAASALQSDLHHGWPFNDGDEYRGVIITNNEDVTNDGQRLVDALDGLVEELKRRGTPRPKRRTR